DGIRDFHVTGVQTCALPISTESACVIPAQEGPRRPTSQTVRERRVNPGHGPIPYAQPGRAPHLATSPPVLPTGSPQEDGDNARDIGRASCRGRELAAEWRTR